MLKIQYVLLSLLYSILRLFLLIFNHSCLQDGWTPLTRAVYNNRPEAVIYLLSQGAQVNTRNRDGCNSLMWACAKGFSEIVQLLVEHGADVNAQNPVSLHLSFAYLF